MISAAPLRSLRGIKRQHSCPVWKANKSNRLAIGSQMQISARNSSLWFSMPDAIELLKTRRSMKPREMTGPGPSPAEIETILTIGARVPDHGKLAPWRFILFEGDARARAGEIIAKVFAKKSPQATAAEIEVEKKRLTDAPLVIGVISFTR